MAATGPEFCAGKDQNLPPLDVWLDEHGLGKYVSCFKRAGADLALVMNLSEEDLRSMGVATLGARKKIKLGVEELKDDLLASGADDKENVGVGAKPGSILRFFQGPSSTAAPPLPTTKLKQLQPAVKAPGKTSAWAHAAPKGSGRRWGGPRAAAVIPVRSWQLVPGTGFVVDRFSNLPPSTPNHKHWFLTHFHADHYKGLTSRFDRGMIYCTPVTAALVRQQLRVRPQFIREVEIGSSITVDGVSIAFLPANHCPGAAMMVFRVPGRVPFLHTGDCRLAPAIHELPELQELRGGCDLVLDTTYCDPQYTFPPQDEVLRFVADAVKAEAFNPRTLFMFGSYTVGKERLYLDAAKILGKKVYVSATKKKVLDCLKLGEDAALLTTDDAETNLHAVPLWMVSHKHMANALRHYRGRFTNVVGFQPTGWNHQRDTSKTKALGRRRQKGTIIIYQVPYSEHSSFDELRGFVEWLCPRNILPSVNNDSGPKAQRMVALLRNQV